VSLSGCSNVNVNGNVFGVVSGTGVAVEVGTNATNIQQFGNVYQPSVSPGYVALQGNSFVAKAVVNFNSANTDNAITITLPPGFTRYRINALIISGASASLAGATFGVFTATGGGGTAILAAGATTTVSTASESTNNNSQQITLTITNTTMSFNNAILYFRVGTAVGSAATATVGFWIVPLS
jgi:hypothetical protein